jgi:hypothetical protein
MRIEELHINLKVRHPHYGVGVVKTIGEHTAEIQFEAGRQTVEPVASGLQPAEAQAALTGLSLPLAQVIEQTVAAVADRLGVERPDAHVEGLLARWRGGRLVLHPSDPTLSTKEVPLEVFFHKIVMMRNQLRVLEQKLNAHEKFTEVEKVDLQQYLTRCYGSMTTFNILFKEKEDQF